MPNDHDPAGVLQRALLLERQQGFADRAAVGGLSSFARMQLERDRGDNPGLRHAVHVLTAYRESDRRGRETKVAEALQALLTRTAPAIRTQAQEPRRSVTRAQEPAPKPGPRPRPALSVVRSPEDLLRPVTTLRGVGPTVARTLGIVGVRTVRDLLYYFPRTHYDFSDQRSISRMRVGEPTTLVGTVTNVRVNRIPGRGGPRKRDLEITTVTVADDTGTVGVRFFNQPYLVQRIPVGARIAVSGEPDVRNGYIEFLPRDYELIEREDLTHAGRLVPVYPLTKGLYQRSLRQLIRRVVEEYAPALTDFLPDDLRNGLRLPDVAEAVSAYHFPDDEESKAWAQQRLAFDELLMIQLGLLLRKRDWQQTIAGVAIPVDEVLLERFCASLPFELTGAQRRAIAEILEDMARPVPMSRLLQGDVGSGKTVVAAAALVQVVTAGKQGVLMAPTEILAEQHYRTLADLLEPFGVRIELLIGSVKGARRKQVLAAAASGEAQVLVGTHALIQEGVELAGLGLAITDEQHRFGVEQRAMLRSKGLHPHILAMTATPIPRTLAMTIYGDLDVSSIDEMPPGRLPIITTWSRTAAEAYGVVRDEVRKGRQAFVICPVIEESEVTDMRSVMAEHAELQASVFPDLSVGLLHGKMKAAEKDRILTAFRNGDYHVLVATSVVEVGIDVPNATVMVIRDAHRFGLAQLHQFRGRVGRGGDQAFCVLLSASQGDEARERLEALTATENGFELAEEDLRLRGPGEFWGTRQSGLPELRVATLGDLPTIELARTAAREMLAADPDLTSPELEPLRRQVERFWSNAADLS
jgi:ATP-dependent DNA helicase RecG